MSADFLNKILEHKKSLLSAKKAFFDLLAQKLSGEEMTRYQLFKKAISDPGQINLIAEIKKASPSRGLICEHFDVLSLAKIYVEHQAAALSILTEDKYFLGKPDYIKIVSGKFNVPILTKDFIIDEGQIFEAFTMGASAILLIVAILDDITLKHLINVSSRLDMDCLVEVHDEAELERALKANAEIIGINNRDLRTFHVDLKVCERLIKMIPKDKVIVAESGIESFAQVELFQRLGAHAVLIGETFLKAANVGSKIEEIMRGKKYEAS